MITALITWATSLVGGKYRSVIIALGGAVLIAVVAGLIYWKGAHDKSRDVKQEQAVAEARVDTTQAKADGGSAVQAEKDGAAVASNEEARNGSFSKKPDSRPGDVRRALNCRRLFLDGRDIAKVPGCVGIDPAR